MLKTLKSCYDGCRVLLRVIGIAEPQMNSKGALRTLRVIRPLKLVKGFESMLEKKLRVH